MLTNTARRAALEEARRWFRAPDRAPIYDAFQAVYLSPPRTLFLEVALHQLGRAPRRVLDVGCGTGEALGYLVDRLPDAEIVGVDPEPEMLLRATARTGGKCELRRATLDDEGDDLGTFDLILSYSTFRFWDHPAAALRRASSLLCPGGLACIQDLRRDMDEELRSQLLQPMETPELRGFLAAQIDSAYSIPEVRQIIEDASIKGCALGVGGLAGLPERSPGAFAMIQHNERLLQLLLQLSSGGFRVARGNESVFHLSVRG